MKISIPVLITDGGDGSYGIVIFKTDEQRTKYAEQEEKLYDHVLDEAEQNVEIEVNADGTWNIVRNYAWEQSIEELLEERDRDIAEQEAE